MNLLDLLTRPRDFFTALRAAPPSTGRYLWLVLLSGLIGGLYAALAQRPVQDAMAGLPGMNLGSGFGLVIAVISALVITLLMWLVLWGLGTLGAGKEGRAAEVYGAAMLPSLLISLVLLPLSALFPVQLDIAPPNLAGLEGPELARAIQTHTQAVTQAVGRYPLSIAGNVLGYAGMAWMFYLAWVGFGILTTDRGRAMRGVLIPLAVFLLLGLAGWLLGRAATSMMGGV